MLNKKCGMKQEEMNESNGDTTGSRKPTLVAAED